MLYREIIAVCSEIHTKHINTLCGQNVELLDVKSGGTYNDLWALESSLTTTSRMTWQYTKAYFQASLSIDATRY
jgi:hypothetical protein